MTEPCPACGSTVRQVVAPGKQLCAGQIQQVQYMQVPDENGPRDWTGQPLAMTVEPRSWTVPCRQISYENAEAEADDRRRQEQEAAALRRKAEADSRARAEEQRRRQEELAKHQRSHDLLVEQRERVAPSPDVVDARLDALRAKISARPSGGPSFRVGFGGWLVALLVAFFTLANVYESEDEIPPLVIGPIYAVITVAALALSLYPEWRADAHQRKSAAWHEEMHELRMMRGCGSPSCRSCYAA